MSRSLSISEAVAMLANPAASVGFQTDERDDTSSNNVVSFNPSKRGGDLSFSEGAAMLAEREQDQGRGGQSKKKFRDPGGNLSIEQGAQLLIGQAPKYEGRALTRSEGRDLLLNGKLKADRGELTRREAVELLTTGGRRSSVQASSAARSTDYVIESQNAAIAFTNAGAVLQNLGSQYGDFERSVFAAFPDVVADPNGAVMRLSPARFGQFLLAEQQLEQFKDTANVLFAQHAQAWAQAVYVENMEFLAQNPDFEDDDANAMAAVLVAVVGEDEAVALASSPHMTVSASDPRVFDVLKLAAGSDDGESIVEMLRGAGFSNGDIAAIANRTARCHVLDHRVRAILLRATRNVEFVQEED